ncbi:unnamed protein product [Soboliphyme baturini]|uniref:Uncharacterized protein n=1 Tax=Soboliphyme baturini TaxID=241478 RepID=A0A183J1R4_9BILA|nr:unnamed protein product [Soboliphyme baturini]
MMYGAGDVELPLIESAEIIESFLKVKLKELVNVAQRNAETRSRQYFDVCDLLFSIRRNEELLRCVVYGWHMKDVMTKLNSDPMDIKENQKNSQKRINICRSMLHFMNRDCLEEIVRQERNSVVRRDRLMRIAYMTLSMTAAEYERFTAARQVSFLQPFATCKQLQDFVVGEDPFFQVVDISVMSCEVLAIIAHEIVLTIMDYALGAREKSALFLDANCLPYVSQKPKIRSKLILYPHQLLFENTSETMTDDSARTCAITPFEVRESVRLIMQNRQFSF